MNGKIDTKHLRQVGLTKFDIQLLSLLMKSGGEYPMPETVEAQALVETSRAKNLVEVIERFGARQHIRLTDEGRIVLGQLEAMAVQPKVEAISR